MTPETPLVVIRCATYNQAAYIRQCLDGFVMQRTDFAFVAIVHDDCSTDGTDDIVREYAQRYPNIIKPIFETENQYSKGDGSLSRIMNQACNNTGAKYMAMCEGDDYWTDPLKLQKQVDFLENHPEYELVFTNRNILKNGEIKPSYHPMREYSSIDILSGFIPGFQTLLLKIDNEKRALISKYNGKINGDILIPYIYSTFHPIYCLPDITATYRYSGYGVHSSLKKQQLFETSIRHFFIFHEQFNFPANNVLYRLHARLLFEYCWSDLYQLNTKSLISGVKYIHNIYKDSPCKSLKILPNFIHVLCKQVFGIIKYKIRR